MKVEDFTSPDSGSGIFHFNSPNFTWRFWSLWSIVHAIQNLLGHPVQSGKLLELSFSFWSNSMIWPLTEKFVYKQKFAKLSLDSILRNNNTIWKVLTARGFFLLRQPSQNKKQEFCGFDFSREIEVCQHSNKTVTTLFSRIFSMKSEM